MGHDPDLKTHFVYILQCADGRYYTGYTTDLEQRLKKHQLGSGAKFTRAFGAKKILYHETFPDKSSALKREAQLKSWPRAKKEALIFIRLRRNTPPSLALALASA
ncbi:MAG: GIY-YIG nuclease family protein [Deltaproteobacteria bacterium]|nr:GIY-YIG nuclease family protein [Deltaproteobacteria bacterium]